MKGKLPKFERTVVSGVFRQYASHSLTMPCPERPDFGEGIWNTRRNQNYLSNCEKPELCRKIVLAVFPCR